MTTPAGAARRRRGSLSGTTAGIAGDASVITTWDGRAATLAVSGSYPGAAFAANAALLRALFHEPRQVVCDLSAVQGGLDEETVERIVDTGGQLEHWPGTQLGLVLGARVQHGLGIDPPAGGLVVGGTVPETHLELSGGPAVSTARLELDPVPRASRAARDFVSRTCLDWQRPHGISAAVIVVSELVTNGLTHAGGTPLAVTLSAAGSRLRLAVQDGSDVPPRPHQAGSEHRRGRGMHVVAGFSRAWGWLPGPDGGKSVWVVLDS